MVVPPTLSPSFSDLLLCLCVGRPEPEPQPVAPGRTKKKYGGVQVLPSGIAAVPAPVQQSAPSHHSSSTSSRSITPEPAPRVKHEAAKVESKPEYDLPPDVAEDGEEEDAPAILP